MDESLFSAKSSARIFCLGDNFKFYHLHNIRVATIYPHWKEGKLAEQIIANVLAISLCIILSSMYDVMDHEASVLSFEQTNILKLANINYVSRPSTRNTPSVWEIAMYMATLNIVPSGPPISILIPFVVNYDHVKLIVQWVIREILGTWST